MADKLGTEDFISVMEQLIEVVDEFRLTMIGADKKLLDRAREERLAHSMARDAQRKNTKATDENTNAKKASTLAMSGLKDILGATAREFVNIGREGIKFAETIGTTATRGVQLEINNRLALASQLTNFNVDLQVTMEQLQAAQKGFTDVFTGAAEGMQVSAEGSKQFVSSLSEGFKSRFAPTAETFRILTQMGMTTTKQFDVFRKATGRASLSNEQLSTLYNKNSLSFLLYGNSFGRAAVQAERLGINLASIQGAQEGLVTNLDGTIDTVAQLNQLGANIDFSNLVRIAETEGPQALLAYVRATVPEQMMQSASTRSLFKQLGISVEDYMKSGDKQSAAANSVEKQLTETARAAGFAARTATQLAMKDQLLTDALGEVYTATKKATSALIAFAGQLLGSGIVSMLSRALGLGGAAAGGAGLAGAAGFATVGMGVTTVGVAAAGLAAGMYIGNEINKATGEASLGDWSYQRGTEKKEDEARATQLTNEIIIKTKEQAAFQRGITVQEYETSRTSGRVPPIIKEPNPTLTKEIEDLTSERDKINKKLARGSGRTADDLFSPGYGNRVLSTPTSTFALNNTDDIIAGTNLFPKGTLSLGESSNQRELTELARKVQALIDTLSSATTVVNIDNINRTIPRMQLVGVYSRNEVR